MLSSITSSHAGAVVVVVVVAVEVVVVGVVVVAVVFVVIVVFILHLTPDTMWECEYLVTDDSDDVSFPDLNQHFNLFCSGSVVKVGLAQLHRVQLSI